jgi:hypothetical protein
MARGAAVAAAELATAVGVSVPTLHRLLQEIADQVVSTGKARRTRYALRRGLRGDTADLPVYEVDAQGRADLLAPLTLVRPQGSCMQLEGSSWPAPEESRDGWSDGLPYLLQDMRPRGYMGRQFARAEHRLLGVSSNPDEWGDDDVLWVLSQRGADTSGNLIVGDAAYQAWQRGKTDAGADPIPPRALNRSYEALAEQAIASGVGGSSAAGEFPKFPALREWKGSDTPHVLVKFSGSGRSSAVQRWSDLLVCEHLALECAASLPGVASARSRIVSHAGRTFLEVERFDRHGLHGRSPLISLGTLDAAWLGDGSTDWTRLAARFAALGLVSPDDEARIQRLWWYGRLVANTDMHTGNLSFRPHHTFSLAPVYDMVPMLYAPLPGGEVPQRDFEPPLPLPPQRAVWSQACEAALLFWQRAAEDARLSAAFRRTCAANLRRLRDVAQHA